MRYFFFTSFSLKLALKSCTSIFSLLFIFFIEWLILDSLVLFHFNTCLFFFLETHCTHIFLIHIRCQYRNFFHCKAYIFRYKSQNGKKTQQIQRRNSSACRSKYCDMRKRSHNFALQHFINLTHSPRTIIVKSILT